MNQRSSTPFGRLVDKFGFTRAGLAERVEQRLALYQDSSLRPNEGKRAEPKERRPIETKVQKLASGVTRTPRRTERRWFALALVELVKVGDDDRAINEILRGANIAAEDLRQELDAPDDHLHIWQRWPPRALFVAPGLRLLGLPLDPQDAGPCAIVLPTFGAEELTKRSDLKTSTIAEDTAAYAKHRAISHARHDVLVAYDLVRLFAESGLDAPIIVQDDDAELLSGFAHRGADGSIQLKGFDGPPEPMSVIISVGLFSNRFSSSAASLRRSSIQIKNYRARQQRTMRVASKTFDMPSNVDQPGQGAIARLVFEDCTISVLGGMTALATARLGDFVGMRATELWYGQTSTHSRTLTNLADDGRASDFGAAIEVPRKDRRSTSAYKFADPPPQHTRRKRMMFADAT